MSEESKIPFYKKNWFIILTLIIFFPVGLILMWIFSDWGKKSKWIVTSVIALLAIIGSTGDDSEPMNTEGVAEADTEEETTEEETEEPTEEPTQEETTEEITEEPTEEETTEEATEEQTEEATEEEPTEEPTEEVTEEEPAEEEDVPSEWQAALDSANTYADMMNMSRQGIYDQLVSSAGDDFPEDAAQYAYDNIEYDWNENALESAKTYRDTMSMSNDGIYDQLLFDEFTEEQAQYAVDNLE